MVEQMFIKSAAICCPDPDLLAGFKLSGLSVDNNLIPAAMRRRTSLTTRMAITAATTACAQAAVNTAQLPAVFASLGGEIQVTDAICRLLPNPGELLSPTQFHNSVHNTTAGYWSILNQCQASSTAIAAVDDTFAMGLLEAWTQLQLNAGDLLLVCYDEVWPQYLAPPIGQFACACALVLSTARNLALGRLLCLRLGRSRSLWTGSGRIWSTLPLPLLHCPYWMLWAESKQGLFPSTIKGLFGSRNLSVFNMSVRLQYDVIVAGAGPAGSTAATLLAQYGYQVLMLEQAQHPRFHIGESMLPRAEPIMQRLGIDWGEGNLVKGGAIFMDEASGRTTYFPLRGQYRTFQVERSLV